MIIPKLAVRNLLGAGIKTWLNAAVLSLSFVAIISAQGFYNGIDAEISRTLTEAEYGGGQFWVRGFDPFDPFTLQDAHAALPPALRTMVEGGRATPILFVQATIYPNGRIRSVLLKGIDPAQKILSIPAAVLKPANGELPVLIGARMAAATGLKKGDIVTVRWRDARGTFDAREVVVVEVMQTVAQSIDDGQVWLPLETLRTLAAMPGQATIVVTARGSAAPAAVAGWDFRGLDYLLKDIKDLVAGKTIGASIFYTILMFLAMLAVFDTQLLSIWRRRREIGTMMALGITRGRLVGLFTFEGALHAVFAAILGGIWGLPLLYYFSVHGISFTGKQADSMGFALSEGLYPIYSAALVLGTTILVFGVTVIVSYLPARKIAKLKPTDALRGRMS